MKKRLLTSASLMSVVVLSGITVFALTGLYRTTSQSLGLQKKTIFEFNLETSVTSDQLEIGPGESISVSPAVYNDATEDMYVFVEIQMPYIDEGPLYDFVVDEQWQLIESKSVSSIYMKTYAYISDADNMCPLNPGDTTPSLTDSMQMKSITNAEYAIIDSIDVVITGYVIGTEDVSTNPREAWEICKYMIENQ